MGGFLQYWNEAARLDRGTIRGRGVEPGSRPEALKTSPGSPAIDLPRPGASDIPPVSLWEALRLRRSVRDYREGPVPLGQLAALLWACQGVTARQGSCLLRPAPSAGALYPFETYVFLNDVEGAGPALAHLDVAGFRLEILREGELGDELAAAALGQRFLARAPIVFAWTAVPARCGWKYGDRASRYIGLDLGHACQNLCLAAVALGMGACPVGAFLDGPMNALLGVDGEEEYAFYLASAGCPA